MTIWEKGEYFISTDKEKLDIHLIFSFLSQESYWAKGIPRKVVEQSIAGSALCFGIYHQNAEGQVKQVGFARVISDLTSFAYLCDVFVIPDYRGQELSKWLIEVITQYPELTGVRRFMLATADAHSLYAKYGFQPIDAPERLMQILRKNVYMS